VITEKTENTTALPAITMHRIIHRNFSLCIITVRPQALFCMNDSFSLVSLYFPQREIAIPYLRKKPLLSRMGKKRLFAYAFLKEGALYQNLTRSAI
jgi:hypothetical protein